MVKKSCSISGVIGKRVSIFSLTPYTYFESTSGLKYQLKNEKLYFSPVRGLSNEFTKNTVKISISKGKILLFKEI
jgi:thiamine pyrophosphokinase